MSYAVIKTGGKQYRVAEGDKIEVEKIDGEVGASATFDQVLVVSDGKNVTMGAPVIEAQGNNAGKIATIEASVSAETSDVIWCNVG